MLRTMKILPPPTIGDVIDGKYEILQLIGHGRAGVVYAARHQGTGGEAALKVLLPEAATDPAFYERLYREARAIVGIGHPNINRIYEVGTHSGAPYIVTERLAGGTLAERFRRGKVRPGELVRWAQGIAGALAAAHSAGVVHHDLKPTNIYLSASGASGEVVPVVLDLGLGALTYASGTSVSDSGVVPGIPRYRAPEQLQEGAPIDHRVDVYALGTILAEGLSEGDRPDWQRAGGNPNAQANIPPQIAALIGRATAHDPRQRFGSMAELGSALDAVSATLPAGDTLRPPPASVRPAPVSVRPPPASERPPPIVPSGSSVPPVAPSTGGAAFGSTAQPERAQAEVGFGGSSAAAFSSNVGFGESGAGASSQVGFGSTPAPSVTSQPAPSLPSQGLPPPRSSNRLRYVLAATGLVIALSGLTGVGLVARALLSDPPAPDLTAMPIPPVASPAPEVPVVAAQPAVEPAVAGESEPAVGAGETEPVAGESADDEPAFDEAPVIEEEVAPPPRRERRRPRRPGRARSSMRAPRELGGGIVDPW